MVILSNSDRIATSNSRPSNMAAANPFSNDFVGLPIIISDFDALANTPPSNNGSNRTGPPPSNQSQPRTPSESNDSASRNNAAATQMSWNTGFSDFADELWAKMTQGMKQKLREACVEVLKKTEDAEPENMMSWQYDDDARFLD